VVCDDDDRTEAGSMPEKFGTSWTMKVLPEEPRKSLVWSS